VLVLDEIARREAVTVSGTELAQEAAAMPLTQRDPQALRSPAVLAALARSLRNRKVLDKLLGIESPDIEAELIRQAGGGETVVAAHGAEAGPASPAEKPEIVVPQASSATAEGREAIRSLLRK
jgi:hypothetical protein